MARILVVDDSDYILEFTREALEAGGHDVFTARNGLEANKIIFSSSTRPDLILLDIVMPMLNGDKVMQAFKQSEITRSIPVLFYSTKGEDELRALVDKHKNEGYIRKPLSAEELCDAVRRYLP